MTTLEYGHWSPEPIRYWYVVALSATWLALMISMWWLMWGGDTLPVLVAGCPGSFLPAMLELEGAWLVLVQLLAGAGIMAGVGLLQDYLRVPAKWAWTYTVGVAFGVVCWFTGMGQLWADALFWGCIGLYAVSSVLCLVWSGQRLWRWLVHRAVCRER